MKSIDANTTMIKTPPEDFKDILINIELPPVNELLTTQELKYGVALKDSLRQKLQLEVIETTRNYNDLAGAEEMKLFFKQIYKSFDKNKVDKITVFLLGIPGAGKTFVA